MLAWGLSSGQGGFASVDAFFAALWREPAVIDELVELLGVVDGRSATRAGPSVLPAETLLSLHAHYSRAEIVAALGSGSGPKPKVTQSGILWAPQAASDVFFVDLKKVARDYSPTTMYRDYAVNRKLFHWESQSRQHEGRADVRRYIDHIARGSRVWPDTLGSVRCL